MAKVFLWKRQRAVTLSLTVLPLGFTLKNLLSCTASQGHRLRARCRVGRYKIPNRPSSCETNDAEVFGEVAVKVARELQEPRSLVLPPPRFSMSIFHIHVTAQRTVPWRALLCANKYKYNKQVHVQNTKHRRPHSGYSNHPNAARTCIRLPRCPSPFSLVFPGFGGFARAAPISMAVHSTTTGVRVRTKYEESDPSTFPRAYFEWLSRRISPLGP